MIPNNRQWAIIAWIVVAIGGALLVRAVRLQVPAIVRLFFSWKIIIPFALLAIVVLAEVWIGESLGLWTPALATDSAFWFVTVAVVLLFGLNRVSSEPDFFKRTVLAAFGFSLVLEVLNDTFVLPLWTEVPLMGLIILCSLLVVVATLDPEQAVVGKVLNRFLVAIALGLLLQAVVRLIVDRNQVDWAHFGRQLALPLWLMVGVLPFVYFVGLLAAYETFFIRMRLGSELSRWALWRNELAVVSVYRLRARTLGAAEPGLAWKLGQAGSAREVREQVSASRRRQALEERRQVEAADRLVTFAGTLGTDVNGFRLDRREFEATRTALLGLSFKMMGWHRNQGAKYPADLIERLRDDFTSDGLPNPSGIVFSVAADGQRWFAWRRTVTGWCFAIGAAGPPPDQWKYDGAEPPTGYPGDDPAWGSEPFVDEAARNWSDPYNPDDEDLPDP